MYYNTMYVYICSPWSARRVRAIVTRSSLRVIQRFLCEWGVCVFYTLRVYTEILYKVTYNVQLRVSSFKMTFQWPLCVFQSVVGVHPSHSSFESEQRGLAIHHTLVLNRISPSSSVQFANSFTQKNLILLLHFGWDSSCSKLMQFGVIIFAELGHFEAGHT